MHSLERSEHTQSDQYASIEIKYLRQDQTTKVLKDPRLMALIDYGPQSKSHPDDPRYITVGLEQLGESKLTMAIFSHDLPHCGGEDGVGFCYNDDVLFGHVYLNEEDFTDIYNIAEFGYGKVLALLESQGFPHLVRVWNYLSDINVEKGEVERYRAFCSGRYETLKKIEFKPDDFPAASAIGTRGTGVLLYFLAAKQPGIQIENPRQVSAFKYPKQYGPTSPSFSRATLKQWRKDKHLYISGTASIVGYESKHQNDTLLQLQETLNNLKSLIDNCQQKADVAVKSITDISLLTVYLRHTHDYAMVKQQLESALGKQIPTIYLCGDICRNDLVIEIEGIYLGC